MKECFWDKFIMSQEKKWIVIRILSGVAISWVLSFIQVAICELGNFQ